MRLLVIEDETFLREQLCSQLRAVGYAVDSAANGRDGLVHGREYPIDLAVVDLGLPDISGMEVIRAWRKNDRRFPVLILTARGRWQDKVEGLEAGADDYLVKPFQFEELLARTKALLRRAAGQAQAIVSCGPIMLDTAAQQVRVGKQALELTAYEYKVLEYLMLHAGDVVSKTTLTEHIYDQDFDRDSNVIEVFIGRLRKKLDPDERLNPIETCAAAAIASRFPAGVRHAFVARASAAGLGTGAGGFFRFDRGGPGSGVSPQCREHAARTAARPSLCLACRFRSQCEQRTGTARGAARAALQPRRIRLGRGGQRRPGRDGVAFAFGARCEIR